MKTVILPIVLSLSLLTGCSIFSKKGNASKAEETSRSRVESVNNKIKANTSEKLDTIAGLAYGTDYALSKVNEPPREVTVARDINQRVVSLAGSPSVEKMKEMQETIDKLTSQLELERDKGKKAMKEKDSEITALQNETKLLATAKEEELRKYMLTAKEAAANADAYKSALDDYQGWFGLKAVFKGLWQFIKSSMWILGIGGILFFVLRIASASNPVCGAIFGIFEQIIAWGINTIKVLFPKALQFAGHTANDVVNVYKSTLSKIVDGIQVVKDRSTAAGTKPDLNAVLDEVAKTMNTEEKVIVEEIKKALNWK